MNENKENETTEEEIEDAGEVLEKTYEFTSANCRYKQRGIYLVCMSCELQHAEYIGINRIMVGEDERGRPILKKRSF
jgi:hypothetical protein